MSVFAEITAPPTGISVDKTFTVTLPTNIPDRCISFEFQTAIAILDRDMVEAIANDSALEEREFQRLRHEDLLKSITKRQDKSNCAVLTLKDNAAQVLPILLAVSRGKAVVISSATGLPVDSVLIHYTASENFGGHVSYRLPGGRGFYSQLWWVR